MKFLLVLLVVLSGCSVLAPPIDICATYPTPTEQSYCYASNEVTAARRAVAQSLRDGAITVAQAKQAAEILTRADAALDITEKYLIEGNMNQAEGQLRLVRNTLLELKR